MNEQAMTLPGFEDVMSEEPVESDTDGIAEGDGCIAAIADRYFDAAALPDTPTKQDVAHGAKVYMVYLVCPSEEIMVRTLRCMSFGKRKSIQPGAEIVSVDMSFKENGKMRIETLEGIMHDYEAQSDMLNAIEVSS